MLLVQNIFPHLHPDQSLNLALERMSAEHLDVLLAVSRANIHEGLDSKPTN